MKKRSLLEEIQKNHATRKYFFNPNSLDDSHNYQGYTPGKPIIVVPGSNDYPGNICLKNAVQFLRDGVYIPPDQVKLSEDDKYQSKFVFEKKIGE